MTLQVLFGAVPAALVVGSEMLVIGAVTIGVLTWRGARASPRG